MQCDVTYDDLSRFGAGELEPGAAREMESHVAGCAICRDRLETLRDLDVRLQSLRRSGPSASAVLEARRALSRELRGGSALEIMTLDDVAGFLRISPQELDDIAGELPAFEIAGHVRIRRERLLEWLKQRERDYRRSSVSSDVSVILSGDFGKGVA